MGIQSVILFPCFYIKNKINYPYIYTQISYCFIFYLFTYLFPYKNMYCFCILKQYISDCYTIRFLIELERKSTIITIIIIPSKMIPTLGQFLELNAKISGVPIPPAPITPKIAADRTLISKR